MPEENIPAPGIPMAGQDVEVGQPGGATSQPALQDAEQLDTEQPAPAEQYTVYATEMYAPVQGFPVNTSGVVGEVTGVPLHTGGEANTTISFQQAFGGGGNPWAEPRAWLPGEFGGTPQSQLELRATHMHLLQLAKSVRWFALLDCLLCLLNGLALAMRDSFLAWIPLVVIIGPVFGYKGAQTFKKKQVSAYALFSLANLAYRIADSAIAVKESDPALLLSLIMVAIEMYITRIIFRFYQLLRELPEEEVVALCAYCGPVAGFAYW